MANSDTSRGGYYVDDMYRKEVQEAAGRDAFGSAGDSFACPNHTGELHRGTTDGADGHTGARSFALVPGPDAPGPDPSGTPGHAGADRKAPWPGALPDGER